MKKVFHCEGWQNDVMEVEVILLAEDKNKAEEHLREEFGSGYDLFEWVLGDASNEDRILTISYPNQGA